MFHIGQSIKRMRRERGLSQNQFANECGMTPSYLCLLENGRRTPSLSALAGIAEGLKIPLEVLLWDSVELPDDLSPDDRRICESAKMIVRRFFEAHDAESATTTE